MKRSILFQCNRAKYLYPLLLTLVFSSAEAGIVRVIDMGGGLYNAHITSLKELRFKNTIRQEHDFSCGSAALATLLTYHYDDPVSEKQIFNAMFEQGDKKKIEREGFSLLDMKRYLQANGYHADGYIANLDKVSQVGIPVIVLINNGGYMHFVVVKGIDADNVLLGDPATGARTLPRSEFESIWTNKLVFVIHDKKQTALSAFNKETDWKVKEKSPLGAALSRDSLGAFSLFLPPAVDATLPRGL
ncbi:MAG: C39 family peptidase [Methylococcales bacterium]